MHWNKSLFACGTFPVIYLSCNTNNIKGTKGGQVSNGCQNWSIEEHLWFAAISRTMDVLLALREMQIDQVIWQNSK